MIFYVDTSNVITSHYRLRKVSNPNGWLLPKQANYFFPTNCV